MQTQRRELIGQAALLALGILATVVFVSRIGRRPNRNTIESFGISLYNAAASNDVDDLAAEYTVTVDEAQKYLDQLKVERPGTVIEGQGKMTDDELKRVAKEQIRLFVNSYQKVLSGRPVKCCESALFNPGSVELIVWAKMPDGKFRGILIPNVIKTGSGYKVIEWLRDTSPETQRVRIQSDTLEGCTFPRALPIYESSRDD